MQSMLHAVISCTVGIYVCGTLSTSNARHLLYCITNSIKYTSHPRQSVFHDMRQNWISFLPMQKLLGSVSFFWEGPFLRMLFPSFSVPLFHCFSDLLLAQHLSTIDVIARLQYWSYHRTLLWSSVWGRGGVSCHNENLMDENLLYKDAWW